MDIEVIRPIIAGLIGAAAAVWLLRKIAKWVPTTCSGKSVAELAHKHRWKLHCANAVGFAALLSGVALYKGGWFASNDWRGLGLSFGAACMLPALLLIVTSASGGRAAIQEALVSYAVGQDTPPLLLNIIRVAGTILFFVAAGSML